MANSPNHATPEPAKTSADLAERQLVKTAYSKVMKGEVPSKREQTALTKHEKEKEERLRWQYYASISQKHWRQMSGRQAKIINEQAVRYGIPFDGPTISLPAVVRALHDFLAENAVKLARDDDDLMQGSGSPALERYREERAAIARLDRLERERELLPRDDVRQAMGRIASIIKGAGDTLQRQFGSAALEILNEAMEDAEREIDQSFTTEGEADADTGQE